MEKLAGNDQFIELISGWTPKSNLEKKLVLGIMHKKNHKDVTELDYAQQTSSWGEKAETNEDLGSARKYHNASPNVDLGISVAPTNLLSGFMN